MVKITNPCNPAYAGSSGDSVTGVTLSEAGSTITVGVVTSSGTVTSNSIDVCAIVAANCPAAGVADGVVNAISAPDVAGQVTFTRSVGAPIVADFSAFLPDGVLTAVSAPDAAGQVTFTNSVGAAVNGDFSDFLSATFIVGALDETTWAAGAGPNGSLVHYADGTPAGWVDGAGVEHVLPVTGGASAFPVQAVAAVFNDPTSMDAFLGNVITAAGKPIGSFHVPVDTTAGDISLDAALIPGSLTNLKDGDEITLTNNGANNLTYTSPTTGSVYSVGQNGVLTLKNFNGHLTIV